MRGDAPGKPLRTVAELAAEFGTTPQALGRLLAADESAPKCLRDNSQTSARARHKWYDPVAVRAWWAKRTTGQVGGTPTTAER